MALPGNKNFSDYDNYITDQDPTTSAQAQDYFRNQAELLKAVIDCDFWQPETVYQPGDVVKSDSMPNGTEAVMVATKASVTSNVEPQWGAVGGANISDGACFWKLRWQHWSKDVEQITDLTTGATNRLPNTSYAVGNVVYNRSNLSVALKCTRAGTTSNTELDVSSKAIGNTVTDGGVVWVLVARDLSTEVSNNTNNFANYLPLGGGVMTGSIQTGFATIIRGVDNTNGIRIYGGTNNDDGAYLRLLGNAINDANGYDGGFAIYTNDLNGNGPALLGLPNGTFRWNGKNIAFQGALSMPYTGAGGITISADALIGNGYTAPNDGWVAVSCLSTTTANGSWARIYDNARQALSVSQNMYSNEIGRLLFPVAKNGLVKVSKGDNVTIETAYFYPAQSEV